MSRLGASVATGVGVLGTLLVLRVLVPEAAESLSLGIGVALVWMALSALLERDR